jgi:hypothetical protein
MGRIVALLIMAATMLAPTAVVAQGGSTGGAIGKQGKSASGGEDGPTAKPAPRSAPAAARETKDALPALIKLSEHTLVGTYTATLRKVGSSIYEATWNNGATSNFTITGFGKDSLTMRRQDTNNWPKLWAGTYTGKRIGGSQASGRAVYTSGENQAWDASW